MAGSAPAAAAQASGGSGAFLRRSVLQQRRHVYHEQRRRKCGGPRLLQNRHASRQVASRWQAEEHAEEAEAEEEQREEQRGRDTQAAGAHPGEEAQLEPFQEQQRERVRARQRGLLAQRRAGAGQLRGLRLQRVQRNHAQRQALQQLVLILRAPRRPPRGPPPRGAPLPAQSCHIQYRPPARRTLATVSACDCSRASHETCESGSAAAASSLCRTGQRHGSWHGWHANARAPSAAYHLQLAGERLIQVCLRHACGSQQAQASSGARSACNLSGRAAADLLYSCF